MRYKICNKMRQTVLIICIYCWWNWIWIKIILQATLRVHGKAARFWLSQQKKILTLRSFRISLISIWPNFQRDLKLQKVWLLRSPLNAVALYKSFKVFDISRQNIYFLQCFSLSFRHELVSYLFQKTLIVSVTLLFFCENSVQIQHQRALLEERWFIAAGIQNLHTVSASSNLLFILCSYCIFFFKSSV